MGRGQVPAKNSGTNQRFGLDQLPLYLIERLAQCERTISVLVFSRGFPMIKRLMTAVAILVGASVAQTALCAPLEATTLYRNTAHRCRTLDLESWSHPTRQVLERAKIEIEKVELCNQDIYPIYTVRFVASPMLGVNDKYFNKLYVEMAAANGFHSFAFVDPGWDVIVTVDVSSKKEVSISYDEFDAAGAK